MQVRERVAEAVERSGLTQAEVARRMGRSRGWVNSRVLGRFQILADELGEFGKALGVHPCLFLVDEEASGEMPELSGAFEPTTGDLIYRETLRDLLGLEPDEASVLASVAALLKRNRDR